MEPNQSGKRPFSFQKLLSANQPRAGFARQPFVAAASKDASKNADASSTRVFNQTTRPLALANAGVELGMTAKNASSNAQSGSLAVSQKHMFRGFPTGIQNFARSEQENFPRSTSYASPPNSSPTKLVENPIQPERRHSRNEEEDRTPHQPVNKSVERHAPRPPAISTSRASLAGDPLLERESSSTPVDPPPMDYAVFQSLVVSRSNAVRELKNKETEVLELRNEIEVLTTENEVLNAKVENLKTETRGYIQKCQNLLSTVQQEGQAFQEGAREAYQRCIDDVRGGIPQVERISSELHEKVEEIHGLLAVEQQNKEHIRNELLHQLEESKHEADFLRDKLSFVMEDLQDAKSRIVELEQTSSQERATLRQTLDLLEASRAEVITLQSASRVDRADDDDCITVVEEQYQAKLDECSSRVMQLTNELEDCKQKTMDKQQELNRITLLLEASSEKVSNMEKLSQQLGSAQELVHLKEKELAILQLKYANTTTQMASLRNVNEENQKLQRKLADISRQNEVLVSKQQGHLSECAEQQELTAEAKKELAALRNQYNNAKTKKVEIEIATADVQRLESKCADADAISRMTKKDLLDLQTSYAKLEQYTKDQTGRHSSQLQDHLNERLKLEELLKSNVALLTKAQEELSQLKLQAEWTNDPEKVDLKSQVNQLKVSSTVEKDKASAKISTLEGQLQASKAVVDELRGNINTIRSQLSDLMREKGVLSDQKGMIAAELDKAQSAAQEASSSLAETRLAHEKALKQHTQDIENLNTRHTETIQALSKARGDYEAALPCIELLEKQLADASKLAEERMSMIRKGEEKWERMEKRMERLVTELSDARSSIQKTSEMTTELVRAKESGADRSTVDGMENTIEELRGQVNNLTLRNKKMETDSTNVLERHRAGNLTEHESALVKEVVASARQINEWDLAQKTNELKRRDATIQGMQTRIKELEKQLAARLGKSPVGQLMTMKDLWSSSPLSNIDEKGVSQTQPMVAAGTDETGGGETVPSVSRRAGISEPDSAFTFSVPKSHVSPLQGIKPSISPHDGQFDPASRAHQDHHHKHNGTFGKLNRALSDDPEMDEIRQFSDQIRPMDIVATVTEEHTASLRVYPKRAVKRNRQDQEEEDDEFVHGGRRMTRGRKVSQIAGQGEGESTKRANVQSIGEVKRGIGAHGRHEPGGHGEKTSAAVARYKAAQRGKLRR